MKTCVTVLAIVLAIWSPYLIEGAPVNSCAEQRPCLTFQEGGCVGGSRTVCLGTNSAAVGCILNAGGGETINNMCGLVNGNPNNPITNSAGSTCSVVAGGTTATFAVLDDSISSGTLSSAGVLLVGSSTATRTGSCRSEQTSRCPNAAAAATNTIWTFAVTSCSCNCGMWSEFSSCGLNCMKTRTRTCSGATDVSCQSSETETMACSGDDCKPCSCSSTWSQWSDCSSTCKGGVSTRTRHCVSASASVTCDPITERRPCGSDSCVDGAAYRCYCGGWTGWSSCSTPCGPGTHSRTRTCSPIPGGPPIGRCPESVFPLKETRSCNGNVPSCPKPGPIGECGCGPWFNSGDCVGTCGYGLQTKVRTCPFICPPYVPRTTTIRCYTGIPCGGIPIPGPIPGCTCGEWRDGICSADCGSGTMIQTRSCTPSCSSSVIRSRYQDCFVGGCGGGNAGRGRGGVRCRFILNRARRMDCFRERRLGG